MQQRAGLEAALPGAGQRQALQALLVECEADRLVPELVRGAEHERRHEQRRHERRAGGAAQRGAALTPGQRKQHRAERGGETQVEAEHEGQAGKRAGAGRRARGEQQRAEPERQRGRIRMREARVGHRRDGGEPGEQRRRLLAALAPHEGVGQHADRGIQRHPQNAPAQQRRAKQPVEPADQVVLGRAVVGVEVAVGKLPVADPHRGLEHQALVVRVDPPPDRRA